MVKIDNKRDVAKVEFGLGNKGACVISVKGQKIVLQSLIGEKTIGDIVKIEEAKELPRIELCFNQTESIDALIECLEKVRQNINYPYGTLFLAC